jgi:hypothetical protein
VCRLLRLLGPAGQTRAALLRRLRLDIRAFYRDLELLRKLDILVELKEEHYVLKGNVDVAVNKVPWSDTGLSLGEAVQLSKGRSAAHRKLKALLGRILPP